MNNTLTASSIPQGSWEWKKESDMYPAGYFTLEFNFDFFNYAGIHRPVVLYTVPSFIHLTDVTLATDVTKELDSAAIYYQIEHKGSSSEIAEECHVEIQEWQIKPKTVLCKDFKF